MKIIPYLTFGGRCEEAMAFYERVLGAKLGQINRFAGSPMAQQFNPEWHDKVMHSSFSVDGSEVFVSDGGESKVGQFGGFSMSINVGSAEEGERVFKSLAEGGSVQMPFAATFWTKGFGMLTDQFGLPWMVNVD